MQRASAFLPTLQHILYTSDAHFPAARLQADPAFAFGFRVHEQTGIHNHAAGATPRFELFMLDSDPTDPSVPPKRLSDATVGLTARCVAVRLDYSVPTDSTHTIVDTSSGMPSRQLLIDPSPSPITQPEPWSR